MKKIKIILKKTKRLRRLLLFILLIVLFCMLIIFKAKDYTYKYKVNNINITESYNKTTKIYYFLFNKGKNTFEYEIKGKYTTKRGQVTSAKISNSCISVKSDLKDFKICKEKNEYVMPNYKMTNKDKYNESYNNIKIYNLLDYKYYIWNYKSLLSITKDNKENIKLFKDDLYSIDLTTINGKYLLIPDYNSEYSFNKIYRINSENDSVKELKLDKDIYFDSYFLGNYKNNTYIYDLNEDKEYKINIKNGKVTKNKYELLINGNWESTSKIKLNKKNQSFKDEKDFEFILIDNNVYYKTPSLKIKITNIKADRIIYSNDEEVFFLAGKTIYYGNIESGISRIMQYSEWEFNNKNIYIFK